MTPANLSAALIVAVLFAPACSTPTTPDGVLKKECVTKGPLAECPALYVGPPTSATILGKAKPAAGSGVVGLQSLLAKNWKMDGGATQPKLRNENGALVFDFPSHDPGAQYASANYLFTQKMGRPISQYLSATFTVTVTGGTPVFHSDDAERQCPGDPPAVHLWFASTKYPSRWWERGVMWWAVSGTPGVVQVAPGTWTITGDLNDPGQWLEINGGSGTYYNENFEYAKANVGAVGMTLGGTCTDYGHGIYVSGGTAKNAVTAYDAR